VFFKVASTRTVGGGMRSSAAQKIMLYLTICTSVISAGNWYWILYIWEYTTDTGF